MGNFTIVPAGFVLPTSIETNRFRLALLGPEHNESDFTAWTSSMDFIRSLPGWSTSKWPTTPMTLEQKISDCTSHLARSRAGIDFAHTVLRPDQAEVIGGVYFKPTEPPRESTVAVSSWTAREYRSLDRPVFDAVSACLAQDWP